MSDLRLLIDEKRRSRMDGYMNDCAGSVGGEGKNWASHPCLGTKKNDSRDSLCELI